MDAMSSMSRQDTAPEPRAMRVGSCHPVVEAIATEAIAAAIEVHTHLGPGLLESVYEHALAHELAIRDIAAERQVPIDVRYKAATIAGQRLDLLAGACVVIELKSITAIQDIHRAQTLSYLRAATLPLGLLINFNAPRLKGNIHRILNERALAFAPSSSSPSRPSR